MIGVLVLWSTTAAAQTTPLTCPDTSPLVQQDARAQSIATHRYSLREDCDTDPKGLYVMDPAFADFVNGFMVFSARECLDVLEAFDPLYSRGVPLYECPHKSLVGSTCETVPQRALSTPKFKSRGATLSLTGSVGLTACVPRLVPVDPADPATDCWVDIDCDVSCSALVWGVQQCIEVP